MYFFSNQNQKFYRIKANPDLSPNKKDLLNDKSNKFGCHLCQYIVVFKKNKYGYNFCEYCYTNIILAENCFDDYDKCNTLFSSMNIK